MSIKFIHEFNVFYYYYFLVIWIRLSEFEVDFT